MPERGNVTVQRLFVLVLALTLTLSPMLLAADQPIVGAWELVSDSLDGTEYTWDLVVSEKDGKLASKTWGEPGEFDLEDPVMKDGVFSYKVTIEGDTYVIEAKVKADKFDGAWKGAGAQGTIKGVRQRS